MFSPFKSGHLKRIFVGVLIFVLFFSGITALHVYPTAAILWKQLDDGLYTAEIDGPNVSKFSDSKVTILKIDPGKYQFEMVISTEYDTTLRTIKEWCEMKNLTGAINAGMYSLKDHRTGTGYLQNFSHINNPAFKEGFNALAVFNPKKSGLPAFQVVDMENQDWKSVLNNYNSCVQSIRMIDNEAHPVYWKNKHVLRCSMTVLATDRSGNVLFLFFRSPYSVNEFIDFLLNSDLQVQSAMYLEGGPEASLYTKTADTEIVKFGSYVSGSNPNDDNVELRKMPNILGFRKKVNE